jgi:Protein of unknown function (DUF1592)/Protein of unknown function (DUF1588)/Protein of unknown function (DUF1587)/Protein of unknown function (DUF1585)/Protein of unknown function (DUF1595)/Ca-dependent carbohydrate-binding module xylan-binding
MGALVKKYCIACHSGAMPSAGIALSSNRSIGEVLKEHDTWDRAAAAIRSGQMPPSGSPAPTASEKDRALNWLEAAVTKEQCKLQDPGRVTLRRLNRFEYNTSVRDLLGADFKVADDFPTDDTGYGFDNNGDVLSISPLLMEKYLNTAEKIAEAAIATPEAASHPVRIDLKSMGSDISAGFSGRGARALGTTGEVFVDYDFPVEGDYTVQVTAYGDQAGNEPAKMLVKLDNREIHQFDIPDTERNPDTVQVPLTVTAGKHRLALRFTNDYYEPTNPNPRRRDRNLYIQGVTMHPPSGMPKVLPPTHNKIVTCAPSATLTDAAAARKILGPLAHRAFRRPVTPAELDRLTSYVTRARGKGQSFERGIQLAVEAILVSPNFIFRVEVDPHPNDPGSKRLLTDFELATRLSYFLWSSIPDDELYRVAAAGKLQNPLVLEAQVKRMLKDPRAHALAENFAGQWLELRNLAQVSPDPMRFPDFNDRLRSDMKTETEMFFESIVSEDRSIMDFIDARYTYLNEPLARHYGITGVTGNNFRKVVLNSADRGGLLGQASILTVTSNPTRTSPVKRGKWVLEQILGTPPPPPPPNVPALDDKKRPLTGTLRQRMEQHRKNPICASCHKTLDAMGFGLENYDATGRWRDQDEGQPIDASGTLPGNLKFSGPAELKSILRAKKVQVARCLTEKLLTYGLGRGVEASDKCWIDGIVANVQKKDYRFSAVITAIVESDPFRKRRGDGGKI